MRLSGPTHTNQCPICQTKMSPAITGKRAEDQANPMVTFLGDLTRLLNQYDIDTKCGIPDYIIANAVYEYVNTLEKLTRSCRGL